MATPHHSEFHPATELSSISRHMVPEYLYHMDTSISGAVMHVVNAILGNYYLSSEEIQSEWKIAVSTDEGTIAFGRYLLERAQYISIRRH